MKIDS